MDVNMTIKARMEKKKTTEETNLCMSTLRATLPSKKKRLINPNNQSLGLSEEDKTDPVNVIQALVKRFGGSVSVQAERTKMGRMFQSEGESVSAWEVRVVEWWSELNIVNMRTLKIKHAATVLLLAW